MCVWVDGGSVFVCGLCVRVAEAKEDGLRDEAHPATENCGQNKRRKP